MLLRGSVVPACVSYALVLCCPVFLFSKATAAPNNAQASPAVIGFDLINIETGAVVRRLADGDVISTNYKYTIVAVTAGRIYSVTFTRPSFRIQRRSPYSLSANVKVPLRLTRPKYVISAFVNNNKAKSFSISINVKPGAFPERGPLPSEVTLDESVINGSPQPVPLLVPACASTVGLPSLSMFKVVPPDTFYGLPHSLTARVSYPCSAQTNFRVRVLSISAKSRGDGTSRVRTALVPVREFGNSLDLQVYPSASRCGPKWVYLEVCVRQGANNALLCGTSNILYLPTEEVPEPLLKFRPPIKLELAPGDKATITMQITNSTEETDGFTNDENQNLPFLIKPVVAKNNYTFSNFAYSATDTVVASLPPHGGPKRGVSSNLNNALVYLSFAEPSCALDSGTFASRYATQVIVSPSVSSLKRQDDKLPEFDKPVYPPTMSGQPVTVSFNVTSPGNGQRADGTPTTLHYQWYVRTHKFRNFRVYAEPIIGATGPTLPIASAECSQICGSRWGVNGILEYYVDVCNTFGCRRSAKIEPNIIQTSPDPQQEQPPFGRFCKVGGCFGGQRYCLIDGSVKLCPR